MDLMELLKLTGQQKKLIHQTKQLLKIKIINMNMELLHLLIIRAQPPLNLQFTQEKMLKKEMSHSESNYLTSDQKELS